MNRLFGTIPAVLRGLGPNAEVDEAVVFAAWKKCAGALLTERTAALEFFESRLIVAVEDETWRRHLEELSPQMLARLNQQVGQGTVTFIEFVIDPGSVSSSCPRVPDPITGPLPEIDDRLKLAAESIADERLREQFISTAADYLSRQHDLK